MRTLRPLAAKSIIAHEILDTFVCSRFTLYWLSGEVFKIQIHENAFLEEEDIRELQFHKARMTKNARHCVLFVTPRFGNLSKEARAYAASNEASINCIAKAVITPNMGMRIFSNMFVAINKPKVPHKVFGAEKEGLEWLDKTVSGE